MYRFTCPSGKSPGDADKIIPGFLFNLYSNIRLTGLLASISIILLAGCAPEAEDSPKDTEVIKEVNFEEAEFAHFVELPFYNDVY